MTLTAGGTSIDQLYGDAPIGRTGGGTRYIDLTDDFVSWLSFANAGMLNKGNLLCFDYVMRNLPSGNPMVEIGSFAGLSTNLINYYRRRHGATNVLYTCDAWQFEGAAGQVGDSDISHDAYRRFVRETYLRNVGMFSGDELRGPWRPAPMSSSRRGGGPANGRCLRKGKPTGRANFILLHRRRSSV